MSSDYGFDERKYIKKIANWRDSQILADIRSDKETIESYLSKVPNSFIKKQVQILTRKTYLRLKVLGRSDEEIERELKLLEIKPYIPPSRVGTRNLNIRLDEKAFNDFKDLANHLSVKNETLFYKALEALFLKVRGEVPDSIRSRIAESGPRRPGPKRGSKRSVRLDKSELE